MMELVLFSRDSQASVVSQSCQSVYDYRSHRTHSHLIFNYKFVYNVTLIISNIGGVTCIFLILH